MDVLDIERGDQQRKSGARAFLFSDFIENNQGIFVKFSDIVKMSAILIVHYCTMSL